MAERHTSSDNDDYDAPEEKPVIPKTEPSSPIPSSSQEKLSTPSSSKSNPETPKKAASVQDDRNDGEEGPIKSKKEKQEEDRRKMQ